jgi:hypothetical protein
MLSVIKVTGANDCADNQQTERKWRNDNIKHHKEVEFGVLITLMMGAARTSETLVKFYQTTLC